MTDQPTENGGDSKSGSARDDRSTFAKAYDLATQVTSICLTLAVPALIGWGLDYWLGTGILLTILGALAGMLLAGWQLVVLVRRLERESGSS
jgi:hypothetical protein